MPSSLTDRFTDESTLYIYVYIYIYIFVSLSTFLSGAMTYVAFYELLAEAIEECGQKTTIVSGVVAFFVMLVVQEMVKDSLH